MIVDHLGNRIAKQHDLLVKGFDLPLKFDPVDQVNGNWHMFPTQSIQEGVLK